MALPARTQFFFWTAGIALFFVIVHQLSNVLMPFVVGSALAYLLDPLADRFERWGMSRFWATAIVSGVCLLIVIGMVVVLVPMLIGQLTSLIQTVPKMAVSLESWIMSTAARFNLGFLENGFQAATAVADIGGMLNSAGKVVLAQLLAIGSGAVSLFLFLLIVPVVMIYMLADWDRAIEKIDSWLPRDHADVIRRLVKESNLALAGFVRGQLLVCVVIAVYYTAALWLIGLDFALSVGIIAGFLSFIPFVGAIAGGLLALSLAMFQFLEDPIWILAVAAAFGVGQILENNVLTPRLMGKSIGLHPVWLLFSLSAFGALFGFVGVLIAVPASAIVGVFARFGVERYLASPLYKGHSGSDPD